MLCWYYVDIMLMLCWCYQRGKPKVVANTGTIRACWKSSKMMIPNSPTSRHPMIKTYCKAWQWRFVNRSHQMSARTAKKLRKIRWRNDRNGPKTCAYSHRKRKTRWKIGTILQSMTHVKYRFRLNETTNLDSSYWNWHTSQTCSTAPPMAICTFSLLRIRPCSSKNTKTLGRFPGR